MSGSQFMQTFWGRREFGRVGFAGQSGCCHRFAAMSFDVTAQAGQCTAHAQKIIHQHVAAIHLYCAVKCRRSGHACPAIGARMGHHIHLQDAVVNGPTQPAPQQVCKGFGNGIDAVTFVGMHAHERRGTSTQARHQRRHGQDLGLIAGCGCQCSSRVGVARFGSPIARMLLDRRFCRVNTDVRKTQPRRTRHRHVGTKCNDGKELMMPARRTANPERPDNCKALGQAVSTPPRQHRNRGRQAKCTMPEDPELDLDASELPPDLAALAALATRAQSGDAGATDRLFSVLYKELHRLARRESRRLGPQATLGATTLLHEAYLDISRRHAMTCRTL